ncbi:hypothetical protein B566_EDAN006746 [Ephemera danica]|nr:hypothetical protein B566_EDAN006746 [Ephemera danica]
MQESGECAVCQLPASQRCGACREVFYCTREHQKQDWSRGHKARCRKKENSYAIHEDAVLGRYLVATRDINAGEVIIREVPIIEAPAQFTPPVCVICYESLTPDNARACDRCGWPSCNDCWIQLSKEPHAYAECTITSEAGRKVNINVFDQHHPSYQSLGVLRCLQLRDYNPQAWKALMALQTHCEKRQTTTGYASDRSTVCNFVLNYMKLSERGFTENDILKVCGALQINGQEVPSTNPPHMALYSDTSFLQHCCIPNCSRHFVHTARGNYILEIRALRAIPQGQNLSICYTDPLWTTENRRMQLQETKYFDCTCERCADPRELGSMMSAVRCMSTARCLGFALPTAPLEPKSSWRCDVCSAEIPHQMVEELLARLGAELAALPQGDCDAIEAFVSRVSGSQLHPNHQYMTDVRLALIQMWGHRCGPGGLGSEPDHVVAAKLRACEQLKAIADILAPGPTALRGLILMELQSAKAEESRRRLICGELDPPGLRASLMESRRLLVEAVEILKLEAASPQDREQAQRACRSLIELDAFMKALPKS